MTRPNKARRGWSVKKGKRYLQEKPGAVWHLSRKQVAILEATGICLQWSDGDLVLSYRLPFPELRALYTRLWYLEKAGKLRRIKP